MFVHLSLSKLRHLRILRRNQYPLIRASGTNKMADLRIVISLHPPLLSVTSVERLIFSIVISAIRADLRLVVFLRDLLELTSLMNTSDIQGKRREG